MRGVGWMDRDECMTQPGDRGALSGLDRKRAVAAIKAMSAITHAIADKTNPSALLSSFAERCQPLVNARVILIELAQENMLLIAGGAAEVSGRLIGQRIPRAGSLAERVLRTHSSIQIEDPAGPAQFADTAIDGL